MGKNIVALWLAVQFSSCDMMSFAGMNFPLKNIHDVSFRHHFIKTTWKMRHSDVIVSQYTDSFGSPAFDIYEYTTLSITLKPIIQLNAQIFKVFSLVYARKNHSQYSTNEWNDWNVYDVTEIETEFAWFWERPPYKTLNSNLLYTIPANFIVNVYGSHVYFIRICEWKCSALGVHILLISQWDESEKIPIKFTVEPISISVARKHSKSVGMPTKKELHITIKTQEKNLNLLKSLISKAPLNQLLMFA